MVRQAAPAPKETPLRPVERPLPLAQRAYDEIRGRVLADGEWAAGRLTEDELARELSISRTPVREALHRLAHVGIVEPAPGGGYSRRRTTSRDVRDQCELRLVLEPPAADLAARRDDSIRDELLASPALTHEPASVLDELEFHLAIANAAGNETLAALIRAVAERCAVHRATLAAALDEQREGRAAIGDALRSGDGDGAAAAMRRHLETVGAAMLAAVHQEARQQR